MGLKVVLCSVALYLIIAVVCVARAQTCNTINSKSYDTNGDLLTLYKITSASACCTACNAFVDAQHWTYCQDSTNSAYQTCVCKSGVSTTLTSSNSFTSGDISRATYHPAGVTVGALNPGQDINGANVAQAPASSAQACSTPCLNTTGCNYWAYYQGICYMKSVNTSGAANSQVTSGGLNLPVGTARTGARGLGLFNSATCTDILALTNVAWIYNWQPAPPAPLIECLLASGIEYIPMQRTLPLTLSNMYVAPNTKHLLTFNEPNFASQANMTPAAAAAVWPQIQQFANQYKLLISSPSAAAGGTPDPISWLDQFFGNCTGCQVDFITTHIYTCSAPGTTNFLSEFKKYGKPIWLTEFDCPNTGNVTTATTYVANTLPLLDADSTYQRYAYFGFRVAPGDKGVGSENNIFNYSSNAFTQIGNLYNTPSSSSTTAAPTPAPTTVAATTAAPTTIKATTVAATTASPTTVKATTVAATTAAPTTTRAATTAAPTAATTAAPTASPTTSAASPIPGKVIIKSVSNGLYVVVDPSTKILNATGANAAAATVFTISTASIGNYTIYSSSQNAYVSADNAGASPLVDNRGSADTWENFIFTKQANGYTITAYINNNFVGVSPSTGLIANVAASSSPANNALFVITTSS